MSDIFLEVNEEVSDLLDSETEVSDLLDSDKENENILEIDQEEEIVRPEVIIYDDFDYDRLESLIVENNESQSFETELDSLDVLSVCCLLIVFIVALVALREV